MSCNITGTLYTPNGIVLANSGVLFEVLTDGAARTAVHVPYRVQSFFTTDDNGLLDADIEAPSSGSWLYRMTIHENGATYDFYLASTAVSLTIDEVLALAGLSGSAAGTPAAEWLNGLYTAVSGADDGKMLETLGGDLTLVDAPDGAAAVAAHELAYDHGNIPAVGNAAWLTAASARVADGDDVATRDTDGTVGNLTVLDAAGNAVDAGYSSSAFDAAGAAATAQAAAIATARLDIVPGIRAAIASRRHDAIVKVSTTIGAALSAIVDNSADKRYLLYVPNGTYTEEVSGKAYVDIVGESQDGVILQSSSGAADTLNVGGVNCMVANMTVRHTFNTGDAGVYQYPIHMDAAVDGATPSSSSTTILYRVISESLGTGAKSGIGIGLNAKQRAYLVDCEASSTQSPGIFAHNAATQTSAVELYLVNTSATGGTYGFQWNNQGSNQTDRLAVFGGTYSGPTADIATLNNGGAGEAYVYLDENVSADTVSLVDATKRLDAPFGASLPSSVSANFNEYLGTIASGPVGVRIGTDGVIKSLRADNVVFLANSANETVLRLTKTQFIPANLYTLFMNATAIDYISSPLADYLRFVCGNATILQMNKALGSAFYLPVYPNAAGSTDLGRTAVGWKRLYIDYTNTATIGNVTINKAAGRVNVAEGASSVTVTNSLCTAASKVFCTVAQNDATAYIKNIVPGAGSFVINLGAAATADCAVDFFIVNV